MIFQEANKDWFKCLEIYNFLLDVPNLVWCRGVENQQTPGVWTTEIQKEVGVRMMGPLLEKGWIHFSKYLFTHTATSDEGNRGFFVNQLRAYEQILSASKGTMENRGYQYHGKRSGKDDVATSAILCIYWMFKFTQYASKNSGKHGQIAQDHSLALIHNLVQGMENQYLSIASRDKVMEIRNRHLSSVNL